MIKGSPPLYPSIHFNISALPFPLENAGSGSRFFCCAIPVSKNNNNKKKVSFVGPELLLYVITLCVRVVARTVLPCVADELDLFYNGPKFFFSFFDPGTLNPVRPALIHLYYYYYYYYLKLQSARQIRMIRQRYNACLKFSGLFISARRNSEVTDDF